MAQPLISNRQSAFANFGRRRIACCLFSIAVLGGCSEQISRQMGHVGPAWEAESNPFVSAVAARQPRGFGLIPAVSLTTAPVNVIQMVHAESPAASETPLEIDQVRCRAATSAILAQLTEIERGLAVEFYSSNRCMSENFKSLQQELLMLRTAKRGNEAAAAALEIYLKLAEAEGQKPLLEASLKEIQSMRADLQELKQHDLPVDRDPGPLVRQSLSIQEQKTALETGISQGRTKLQVLLGEAGFLESIPNLDQNSTPSSAIPDRLEAENVALDMRPELRTLRTIICRLTPETLPLRGRSCNSTKAVWVRWNRRESS